MADMTLQGVGSADSELGTAMYQLFQNQLYKTSDTTAAAANQPVKEEIAAKTAKPDEKQQSLLPVTNSDTFLRFMVDKKTNDITVYVVDRASRRIMRSIPPTDVNNLKAGDLLKLLA